MENLSKKFIESNNFIGNGKYYITVQSGRNYKNTSFYNFYNKNTTLVKIIDKGNDAQRGGKTGDFYVVEFSKEIIDYRASFEKLQKSKEELKKEMQILKESEMIKLKEWINANWELAKSLKHNPVQLSIQADVQVIFSEKEIKKMIYS